MPATGAVQNLSEGRAEALQALESVSDRLGEILRGVPEDGTQRNDNGELVNEEGLPIVDITEPIDDLDTPSLTAATEEDEVLEDNYPEPISKLSPKALALSRKHRDKILDLLEEEEVREQRRTRQEQDAELRRKREAARIEMQKRMATQGAELEKRRRDKEIEKKMAKALVGSLGDLRPVTPKTAEPESSNKVKMKGKSVTFADTPSASKTGTSRSKQHTENDSWGDVVFGRLSEKQRQTSHSKSHPMKMNVVERSPVLNQSPSSLVASLPKPAKPEDPNGDSDDDSNPEDHSDFTLAVGSDEEDVVLSAHHHRELALEYNRRREELASSTSAIRPEDIGLSNDTKNVGSGGWDNEDVPIEATLAHPPPKPTVSKFKEAIIQSNSNKIPQRLPDSHSPDPTSTFGFSVLPPGVLANNVKMGKLVDGKLVAGYKGEEEEQEAQEEEQIRKLLLKSMEDYSGIASQVMGPGGSYWADSRAVNPSSNGQRPSNLKPKPKVSRFKVNRTQAQGPSERALGLPVAVDTSSPNSATTHDDDVNNIIVQSGSSTPSSGADRLSPKLKLQQRDSTAKDDLPSGGVSQSITDSPSAPVQETSSQSVDSSSSRGPSRVRSSGTLPSSIVDSPSFPDPPPNITESPFSCLAASSSTFESQTSPSRSPSSAASAPPVPISREPTIITDHVVERSTNRKREVSQASEFTPRRVSRFKADQSNAQ